MIMPKRRRTSSCSTFVVAPALCLSARGFMAIRGALFLGMTLAPCTVTGFYVTRVSRPLVLPSLYRQDHCLFGSSKRLLLDSDDHLEEDLGSAAGGGDDDSDEQDDFPPDASPVEDEEEILGFAIDSFLRGDYDRELAEDAPAPHPGLSPGDVIESALRSLRKLNDPEPSHGAAVMMKFCFPLSRGERWGDSSKGSQDPWKEILRGALTPGMFARRLRASEFSGLLDWSNIDVTEGAFGIERDLVGVPSLAFVNVALYFGEGFEPLLLQFTLRRLGGVWLIDTVRKSQKELFVEKGLKGPNDTE